MRGVDWTRSVKGVRCFVSLLGVFCVAAALQIHAQTPPRRKAMSLIDLAELPRIAGAPPQLSPDGKSVAICCRVPIGSWDVSSSRYGARISAPAPVQLTFG